MSRGWKMVNMSVKDDFLLKKLNIPPYESTKGSDIKLYDIDGIKKVIFGKQN